MYRTNDDGNGGLASLITFTAAKADRYVVGVQQENNRGSAAYRYDLRITATPPPVTFRHRVFVPLTTR